MTLDLNYGSLGLEDSLRSAYSKRFLFYIPFCAKRTEACKHYCHEVCLFYVLNILVILFKFPRFV